MRFYIYVILIRLGAKVNVFVGPEGWTPLYCALNNALPIQPDSHKQCAKLLIEAGAILPDLSKVVDQREKIQMESALLEVQQEPAREKQEGAKKLY